MPNGRKIWRFSPDQQGTYPTWIFCHGLGVDTIDKVLGQGLPYFLNNGGNIPFNVFATLDNNAWVTNAEMKPIKEYVKVQPGVDPNRMHLTGLSAGGDAVLREMNSGDDDFASYVICSINSNQYVDDIPNMKGRPVRVFHGALDPSPNVVRSSEAFVLGYNKRFPGQITRTVFQNLKHDSWSTVYKSDFAQPTVVLDNNVAFVDFEESIYDWAEDKVLNEVEPEPTTGIFINGKWYGDDHCNFMGYLIEYRK